MTAPHNFSNTASAATLAGSLSSSATSVVLDSFANFPAPPFTATIARNQPTEEIVLVTGVTGFTVTLTRGYDGTSAQAQSPGATFEHTAVAKHFRDAAAHVAATASAHGTTSPVVGVDDVQTLSNKTVVALLALATAGAPALTANAPTGVTSKLLSLKQAGVEKAFVDYLGNLTAQGVTGTTATFSGALSAVATTLASLAVSGNATVGGTLGVTGLLTATGGVTVPTGKKIVLTDAPAAGTDAVNKTYADARETVAKSYADGLVNAPGAGSRKLSAHWGSGTVFPTANVLAGDSFRHTGLGCLFRYNGTAWRQTETPTVASITAMAALPTAALYDGFQVHVQGVKADATWSAADWHYTLHGPVSGATNGTGLLDVAHGGHKVPAVWGVSKGSQATDVLNTTVSLMTWANTATVLTVRATRTDTSTYLASTQISGSWWARW